MNTEELFAKLTKAIAYLYSEDPTVPGLFPDYDDSCFPGFR